MHQVLCPLIRLLVPLLHVLHQRRAPLWLRRAERAWEAQGLAGPVRALCALALVPPARELAFVGRVAAGEDVFAWGRLLLCRARGGGGEAWHCGGRVEGDRVVWLLAVAVGEALGPAGVAGGPGTVRDGGRVAQRVRDGHWVWRVASSGFIAAMNSRGSTAIVDVGKTAVRIVEAISQDAVAPSVVGDRRVVARELGLMGAAVRHREASVANLGKSYGRTRDPEGSNDGVD